MYIDQIKKKYYEYTSSDGSNEGISKDKNAKCSRLLTILPTTIKRKGTTAYIMSQQKNDNQPVKHFK